MQIKDLTDVKKRLKVITGHNQDAIIDDLDKLPKWRLVEAIKTFGFVRKFKFRRTKYLLGDIEKALPEKVYSKILELEQRPKVKLAMIVQGLLALRIGEVVTIHKEDIDFSSHTMIIHNHKLDRYDKVTMSKRVEQALSDWIKLNNDKIESHNGFIFYSENVTEYRDHLSHNWLRIAIQSTIDKTGLNRVYATDHAGKKRKLYTSHSLRGYGITRFYEISQHNIKLTQRFARHSNVKNTMVYIKTDDIEISKLIREKF